MLQKSLLTALASCGLPALSFATDPGLRPDCVMPDCVMTIRPGPFEVRQPDGSSLVLHGFGDAWNHWFEDRLGYPVLRSGDGWFWARRAPDGRLLATEHLAGRGDPRALELEPTRASGAAPSAPRGVGARLPSAASGAVARSMPQPPAQVFRMGAGSVGNLVIVMRFSDHGPGGQDRTLPSAADLDTVMNAVGGDPVLAPTGSVRDHYLENSYGAFTIDSTVVAWVDVPNSEVYYANGNYGLTDVTWELIIDGLTLADPLVDFAQFDQDGDGWIDAITFLHSGYGAEWGSDDQYGTPNWDRMWSHKWTIPTWTSAEGVKVGDYNISPALWGVSGDEAGHIGVVVHELGHFFGLPDLYDTGGGSQGIGNWDVMAGGAWGFDGSQQYPSHMSAWSKSKLGWLTPEPILPGAHVAPDVETNATVFKIDCGYPPGEYLLVENRQQLGFDGVIPQGGLAIWHIDESKGSFGFNDPNNDQGYPGQSGWPNNGKHYRVALLQADGGFDMERNLDRGDEWDIYHAAGVSSITQSSVPDLQAYQDGNLIVNGNRIVGIAASSASMPFDYLNDARPSLTTTSLPPGRIGVPYTKTLIASGGTLPYVWSEYVADPSYVVTDLGSSGFAAVGVAQGWQADEDVWAYDPPFRFPYWETSYGRLYVSSNGFVDVVPVEAEPYGQSNYLRAHTRIAPLWMDLTTGNGGDVFIDESQAGQVTIRWAAETAFGADAVNVALTLSADGTIVFHYGAGNANLSPTVGIGRGHGGGVELVDGYDGAASLPSASSIRFERLGSLIPSGLVLAADGTLSGTPTEAGLFAPVLRVTDASFNYDQDALPLPVRSNPAWHRLPGANTAGPFQSFP